MFSNGVFVLDKFHYKQALNRISKDKDIKQIIHSNIINQNKPTFIDIINAMIKEESKENRKITLSNNKKYILNNWQEIQRAYESKQMGCSMESAISHMFASIFTSRPKAYKEEILERYLNNRIQYLNNVDLRLHYLNTLTEPRTNDYYEDSESIDFSIFEPNTKYYSSSVSNWLKETITKF